MGYHIMLSDLVTRRRAHMRQATITDLFEKVKRTVAAREHDKASESEIDFGEWEGLVKGGARPKKKQLGKSKRVIMVVDSSEDADDPAVVKSSSSSEEEGARWPSPVCRPPIVNTEPDTQFDRVIQGDFVQSEDIFTHTITQKH